MGPGTSPPIQYWDVLADPVDEEKGGTYYRPYTAVWINGTGAPDPTTGDEHDFYLDTDAIQWYGPKGPEDPDTHEGNWPGPFDLPNPGTFGEWLLGTRPPTVDDGSNYDYWLDTVHHVYYGPKALGVWPDGEAIYEEWITINSGPSLPGIFLFPGSTMGVDNSKGGTVSVYMMFKNSLNQKVCNDVLIGQLVVGVPDSEVVAEGSDSLSITHVFVNGDILNPGAIAKVRYKIVGPDGVTWSGGGSMGKLHG